MKILFVWFLILPIGFAHGQLILTFEDAQGNALEDVFIRQGEFSGFSNSKGKVQIDQTTPEKEVIATLTGYEPQSVTLEKALETRRIIMVSKGIVLNELVVSSDIFKNKKREISRSVSLIEAKDIQALDNTNLSPILNNVPGVFMHAGALNTNRITIRGIGSRSLFSTNKIKAYLDGIPLSTGDGETTIEDIDLNLIDHLEVVRGPASSIFGAGLGGVINLSTARPNDQEILTSDVMIGSYGLIRGNLLLNIGDASKGLKVAYQKLQSDGYRENNEYNRHSISLIGKIRTENNWTLTSFANVTSLKAFIPSSIDSLTFIERPQSAAQNWASAKGFEDNDKFRLGLSLSKAINSRTGANISIFTNHRTSFEVRPFGILEEEANNFGMRTAVDLEALENRQLHIVLGAEAFFENFEERTFENNNSIKGASESDFSQNRNYLSLFSALEYKPTERWIFTLGTNFNTSAYTTTDNLKVSDNDLSGDYTFSPIFSPRMSVLYHLTNQLSIFGQWSHGYSLPTFDETLNPDGLVNNDIEPETGVNYEIGIKGSGLQDNLYFEVSLYSLVVENLLVARRVSEDDFIGINAGKTIHNGLEASASHNLINNDNLTLSHRVNLVLTNYYFDDFIDEGADFSGNQLTGVPDYNINYSMNLIVKEHFYSTVNWQFTGGFPIRDDNSIFTEKYDVLNLKVGYRRNFGRFDADIYVGVNNVLDEKYASMILINAGSFGGRAPRYYYPGLPRNWYSGVKIAYKF